MIDREEAPNNDTPEHPGRPADDQLPESHPVHPIEVEAPKASPAELQSPEPDTIKMGIPVEHPIYVSLDNIQRVDALPGDPMAAAAMPSPKPQRIFPEDLRVSWSWPHLILFLFFGFASLLVVQLSFVFYVSANRHLSANQVQAVFESSPQLLVGTNVLWYGLLFLFLYMTLAVLRGAPFWRTLGWRKLNADPAAGKGSGWMYFFSGCGLAIFVAVASYNVKNADHLPIQEIFKNRGGAFVVDGHGRVDRAAGGGDRLSWIPLSAFCQVARCGSRHFDYRLTIRADAWIAAWMDLEPGSVADVRGGDFYVCTRPNRHRASQLSDASGI